MKRLIIFVLMLITITLVFGQSLPIKNYSTNDGLVQSQVTQILQDDDGYIWFLTLGGLSKFDGYSFSNYNLATGLSTNYIKTLVFNNNKTTILGEQSFSIIQGDSLKNYDQNYFNETLKEKVLYLNLVNVSDDYTPFVATKSKIYFYSEKDEKFEEYYDLNKLPKKIQGDNLVIRYPDLEHIIVLFDDNCYMVHLHSNEITDLQSLLGISLERGGTIGIYGMENKEYEYTFLYTSGMHKLKEIIQFNFKTKSKKTILSSSNISEVVYNNQKGVEDYYKVNDYNMFITSEGRIFYYNEIKGDSYFSNDLIKPHGISLDNIVNAYYLNDKLWIATNQGLIEYDLKEKKTKSYTTNDGLSSNNIQSIFVDREDNIWIGTNGTGTDVIIQSNITNYNAKNGLSHSGTTNCTEGFDGSLWVSCDNGLSRIMPNGEIQNYNTNNGLPHSDTWALNTDTNGQIWVGTYKNGLVSFDGNKFINRRPKEIEPSNSYVTSIFTDSNGNVWVFLSYHIVKFDKKYNYKLYKKNDAFSAYEMTEDKMGNLWVALGAKGLSKMSKNGDILNNYPINTKVFNSNIIGLEIIDENTIFCYTYGEGIVEFTIKTGEYKRIFKSRLKNYGITKSHVRDNEGNLWVGTINGIVKINKDNTIKEFKKEDGLFGEDVRTTGAYKDSKGALWFCTSTGLVRIIAEEQNIDSTPPKMHISSFKSKINHNIKDSTRINLAYNDNTVSINFVGIDLRNPRRIRYSYILENFDKDWSPLTLDRSVRYTNLNPGKYTFKIYSVDHADNKSEVKEIHFVIRAPFWKTWWFISLELILAAFAVYIIIQWRLKVLKKKNEQLERLVALRTIQLKEKNEQLLSSIRYAERIQNALLAKPDSLKQVFHDIFVLFKPKDIISGDFYWYYQSKNYYYLAVVDCTGHGVPGALLSIVGSMLLNDGVINNNEPKPSDLLTYLHENIRTVLSQTNERGSSRDGMEVSLCRFDKDFRELIYAGANRPIYYFNKSDLDTVQLIKGNRKGIGGLQKEDIRVFEDTVIDLENIHSLFMFSDGLVDQNDPNDKKFSSRYLRYILKEIINNNMDTQKDIISEKLAKHQGNEPQRDDITMIGVKFKNKI